MFHVWWISCVVTAILVAAYYWRPRRKPLRAAPLVHAKRIFHAQREGLEAKFVRLAAGEADPQSSRWADCTFADDVAYVRNRATGELSAFVAMTVAGDEFAESSLGLADALGNLQVGTAVFRFDRDHWVTDGRAILNLSPSEAVHYYGDALEVVGEELARRS